MGVGGLKCYVKNIITHTGASHTPNGGGGIRKNEGILHT